MELTNQQKFLFILLRNKVVDEKVKILKENHATVNLAEVQEVYQEHKSLLDDLYYFLLNFVDPKTNLYEDNPTLQIEMTETLEVIKRRDDFLKQFLFEKESFDPPFQ